MEIIETKTKYCKYCGEKIPEDAIICTHCGRQVEQLKSEQPQVVINNSNTNTNTNILSMLRLFSIRYPVKNSRPFWSPRLQKIPPQKTRARKKYKRLIHNASETVGNLDFLCKNPRSKARSNATNALKPTHIMVELITPPEHVNED